MTSTARERLMEVLHECSMRGCGMTDIKRALLSKLSKAQSAVSEAQYSLSEEGMYTHSLDNIGRVYVIATGLIMRLTLGEALLRMEARFAPLENAVNGLHSVYQSDKPPGSEIAWHIRQCIALTQAAVVEERVQAQAIIEEGQ